MDKSAFLRFDRPFSWFVVGLLAVCCHGCFCLRCLMALLVLAFVVGCVVAGGFSSFGTCQVDMILVAGPVFSANPPPHITFTPQPNKQTGKNKQENKRTNEKKKKKNIHTLNLLKIRPPRSAGDALGVSIEEEPADAAGSGGLGTHSV